MRPFERAQIKALLRQVREAQVFGRIAQMRRFFALVCMLILTSPSTVVAEEDASTEGRAMELTREALTLYRAGELDRSLELLHQAEQLVRQPVIIYNLARVHEAAGDIEDALARFQEYLDSFPDAPDRGAVTVRIETLQEQLEERERLQSEQEAARQAALEQAARATEAERRADRARGGAWPWIIGAVGLTTLGVAIVLGAVALSEAAEVSPDADHRTALSAQARVDNLAMAATFCFVSGGILAGAGLAWGVVRLVVSRSDRGTHIGLSFGGRF